MDKQQMVHETVVRDVIDVINSVKDYDQINWINNRNPVGSIAKRTSDLVLVFPVLTSTSISIQTASIISKAIERKCVALLQILFAAVNLTDATDLYEYIAQFHSNLNRNVTIDDFFAVLDKMDESGKLNMIDRDAYEAVREDMHKMDYYLSTEFNPVSINEFSSTSDIYGNSNIVLNEASPEKNRFYDRMTAFVDDIHAGYIDPFRINVDVRNNVRAGGAGGNRGDSLRDDVTYFKYQLLPQDVQKANELMPTLMIVNFKSNSDSTNDTIRQTGIIGVKAKLYPIDSMDIISRVSTKYTDKNTLFKFVKATTREISFFRDLVFAIDKIKFDAINVAKDSNNAKIFRLLERRAAKNKFSSLLRKNDASPITSLIMSQDEVEYLKKYNSIDMSKPYVTKSIMEAYNLMNITIADEALEIVRFLYDDGDGIYEAMSFDSLEKEAKDSSYKKVVNLMSKINR